MQFSAWLGNKTVDWILTITGVAGSASSKSSALCAIGKWVIWYETHFARTDVVPDGSTKHKSVDTSCLIHWNVKFLSFSQEMSPFIWKYEGIILLCLEGKGATRRVWLTQRSSRKVFLQSECESQQWNGMELNWFWGETISLWFHQGHELQPTGLRCELDPPWNYCMLPRADPEFENFWPLSVSQPSILSTTNTTIPKRMPT